MSLREKKKVKTRLHLLEAALELIGRQGFEDTTINQIAAAVDVSPRTLLRYFPTKEDVIVSWVAEGMAIFLSTLESRPANEPVHLSLIASARELLNAYEARTDFYLTIERVIGASSSISARKQEMSTELATQVSTVLAQRESGAVTSKLERDLYPLVVFSMIRVVIKTWVSSEGQLKLSALFEEACELVRFEGRGV